MFSGFSSCWPAFLGQNSEVHPVLGEKVTCATVFLKHYVFCHTYRCTLSYIQMYSVIHTDVFCHTYRCILSYIQMYSVIHTDVFCHAYKCSLSYIQMYSVIHTDVLCHTFRCTLSYIQMYSVIHTEAVLRVSLAAALRLWKF